MPFVRRPVARPGIESDEDSEAKSEMSEAKPEWTTSRPLLQKFIWKKSNQIIDVHKCTYREKRNTYLMWLLKLS